MDIRFSKEKLSKAASESMVEFDVKIGRSVDSIVIDEDLKERVDRAIKEHIGTIKTSGERQAGQRDVFEGTNLSERFVIDEGLESVDLSDKSLHPEFEEELSKL